MRAEVLNFGSQGRRFLLAEPLGAPSVIVLSLHGSGSSPKRQARLSSMERFSSSGAVVAFPQGAWPLRSGFEWDLEGDVEYLRALVSWLHARYPETGPRVCIAGMSGGARMASRFASLHPGSVRVLGAVAGLRAPTQTQLEHPLRVVAFHGTADRLNPFAGSSTERWDESVPDAAAAWARALGLPSEPTVRRSPLTSREWTSATPVGWQPSLCSSREEPATRGAVRVCRSSLPSPASSSPPYPPFSCGSPSDGPPRRSTPRPRSGRNRRVCVTGHVHPAPEEPMPTAVAPAL
jgi:poly(3-hydroxybutyrate) depolymerase